MKHTIIPVVFSKLLSLLDAVCERDEDSREALSDLSMACPVQFVKAHRARGCTGGEVFLKWFDKENSTSDESKGFISDISSSADKLTPKPPGELLKCVY